MTFFCKTNIYYNKCYKNKLFFNMFYELLLNEISFYVNHYSEYLIVSPSMIKIWQNSFWKWNS